MEGYVEGYICGKTKRGINADLNASSNITRKLGYKVGIRKMESYIATHNELKPITPLGGVKPETPAVETPPF